jgi:hypothetical protein
MKTRRKKSREMELFEAAALEIARRRARHIVVECICEGSSVSSDTLIIKEQLGSKAVSRTTLSIAGVTLRATPRGWRVLSRRRVVFSGKTFDEFLKEFFPDEAPAPPPST